MSCSTVIWGRPKPLLSPIEAGGAVRGSWFSHPPKHDALAGFSRHGWVSVTHPLTPPYLLPSALHPGLLGNQLTATQLLDCGDWLFLFQVLPPWLISRYRMM